VGSTPEAPDLETALGGRAPADQRMVALGELQATRRALGGEGGGPLAAVSLGTPHASSAELAAVAELLDGRHVAPGVELLISTARDTLAEAEETGVAGRLEAAGPNSWWTPARTSRPSCGSPPARS
jgi:predicted aconitase